MVDITDIAEKGLLAGIKLAEPMGVRRSAGILSSDDSGKKGSWPSGDSAQINAGALLAFDSSLTKQNVADASNSILFAQLAANAQANRFLESGEWSKSFQQVLGSIGWVSTQISVGSPDRMDPSVDWMEVVAKVLAGSNGAALAKDAMRAAAALSPGSDALTIWLKNAVDETQGNFIAAPLMAAANGDLQADMAQIVFQSIRQPDGFLSWTTYYEVSTCRLGMVLNEDVYARVRQAIIDKLGDRPEILVANIPV